jgi:hypothetical protein
MNRLPLIPLLSLALAGCRSRVASLRAALQDDDVARAGTLAAGPHCDDGTCVDALARAFGSKRGFDLKDPDQASAAAVAVLLVRDRRGDLAGDADRWIAALNLARGEGADALRLAVAHDMAELAPRIGKRIDDDAEATALVHDVAGALPGACPSYRLLASVPIDRMRPEQRPEHDPCVQRDLLRKDGPGAAYGFGLWRAAAGVVALWKDEARALRAGLGNASEGTRAAVEKKLAVIEPATAKIELKKVDAPWNAILRQMVHP